MTCLCIYEPTQCTLESGFYRAPGRGASGRRRRPCASRPGKEAVAVRIFHKPFKGACLARKGGSGRAHFPQAIQGGMLGPAEPAQGVDKKRDYGRELIDVVW